MKKYTNYVVANAVAELNEVYKQIEDINEIIDVLK